MALSIPAWKFIGHFFISLRTLRLLWSNVAVSHGLNFQAVHQCAVYILFHCTADEHVNERIIRIKMSNRTRRAYMCTHIALTIIDHNLYFLGSTTTLASGCRKSINYLCCFRDIRRLVLFEMLFNFVELLWIFGKSEVPQCKACWRSGPGFGIFSLL